MTKLIKHKLKFLYIIALGSFLATTLFAGSALAAATCYTYDSTMYTQVSCDLLKNNDPKFKPSPNSTQCYAMRTSPQGNTIAAVDCTAAATSGGDLSNMNTDPSPAVNLGDAQGKYTCGAGGKDSQIKTTINFGCVGKGSGLLDLIFAIVRFLSAGAGLIVIGSLVFAGIQYTVSRGDPSASAAAIKRIQNTAIALLIYIFAFAILNYIVPAGLLK
jgi:hypothetical protein